MTLATNGAVTINDSLAFKEQIFSDLLQSSSIYAPVLKRYMKPVSGIGSKLVWYQQALSQETVQLNGAYTAADSTITVDAPTTINPHSVKVGVDQLMTQDGAIIWDITSVNDTDTVLGVSVAAGSDANVADNTVLYIVRDDDIGADFGAQNDVSFSSTDINYVSNFSHTIRIANPVQDGSFIDVGIKEANFAHQIKNNLPSIMKTLERRVIKDIRTQGANPSSSNGFTRTAGTGSRAGGITSFINSGGGYNPTAAGPISEDTLETDMIALRDRGAFNTVSETTRNMGIASCRAFVSEATLGDINKLIRLERAPEIFLDQKTGGIAGTWASKYVVNGVLVDFEVSDGISDTEVLYLPRDEDVQVEVLRLFEQQPELSNGDNTQRMYTTTYSLKASRPYLMGHRENLTRL